MGSIDTRKSNPKTLNHQQATPATPCRAECLSFIFTCINLCKEFTCSFTTNTSSGLSSGQPTYLRALLVSLRQPFRLSVKAVRPSPLRSPKKPAHDTKPRKRNCLSVLCYKGQSTNLTDALIASSGDRSIFASSFMSICFSYSISVFTR